MKKLKPKLKKTNRRRMLRRGTGKDGVPSACASTKEKVEMGSHPLPSMHRMPPNHPRQIPVGACRRPHRATMPPTGGRGVPPQPAAHRPALRPADPAAAGSRQRADAAGRARIAAQRLQARARHGHPPEPGANRRRRRQPGGGRQRPRLLRLRPRPHSGRTGPALAARPPGAGGLETAAEHRTKPGRARRRKSPAPPWRPWTISREMPLRNNSSLPFTPSAA